jgi:hypothetical protein
MIHVRHAAAAIIVGLWEMVLITHGGRPLRGRAHPSGLIVIAGYALPVKAIVLFGWDRTLPRLRSVRVSQQKE